MNLSNIPVTLVVLIGIYTIAKVIIDTTIHLHRLRDLVLGATEIHTPDPVAIARIRVTALCDSFIPFWLGICMALIVLTVLFALLFIQAGSELKDSDKFKPDIIVESVQKDGKDNIISSHLTAVTGKLISTDGGGAKNNDVYRGFLFFWAVCSFGSAVIYLFAGRRSVRAMDNAISKGLRDKNKRDTLTCLKVAVIIFWGHYPKYETANWIVPPKHSPMP